MTSNKGFNFSGTSLKYTFILRCIKQIYEHSHGLRLCFLSCLSGRSTTLVHKQHQQSSTWRPASRRKGKQWLIDTWKVKRLLCEGIKEDLERWISRSGINSCNLLWVLLHAGTWWSCVSRGELGDGLQEHLGHSHQWCSPLMGSVWLSRWLVWWHCHMRSVSCLPVVPPPVNWHPAPDEPLQLHCEKKWVSAGRNVHTQPRMFSPSPEYFLLSPKSKAEACAGSKPLLLKLATYSAMVEVRWAFTEVLWRF